MAAGAALSSRSSAVGLQSFAHDGAEPRDGNDWQQRGWQALLGLRAKYRLQGPLSPLSLRSLRLLAVSRPLQLALWSAAAILLTLCFLTASWLLRAPSQQAAAESATPAAEAAAAADGLPAVIVASPPPPPPAPPPSSPPCSSSVSHCGSVLSSSSVLQPSSVRVIEGTCEYRNLYFYNLSFILAYDSEQPLLDTEPPAQRKGRFTGRDAAGRPSARGCRGVTGGMLRARQMSFPLYSLRQLRALVDGGTEEEAEAGEEEARGRVAVLQDTTLLSLDDWRSSRFFSSHYFHYMETLTAMWFVRHVTAARAGRLVFPWARQQDWDADGQHHLNRVITEAWLAEVNDGVVQQQPQPVYSEDSPGWLRLQREHRLLMLPHALSVDRTAMQPMGRNKMNSALVIRHLPDLINASRAAVAAVLRGLKISGDGRRLPRVLYISRQSTMRRLKDETHSELLRQLGLLVDRGLCTLHVAALEKLSARGQILLAHNSDIMLAVHGNGLTHALWMPPWGHVLELFPPSFSLLDYCWTAKSLALDYHSFDPIGEWDVEKRSRDHSLWKNGWPFTTNLTAVMTVIRRILKAGVPIT